MMVLQSNAMLTLAEQSRLENLSKALQSAMQSGPTTTDILVLLLALVVLGGLVYLAVRLARREHGEPEQTAADYLAEALAFLRLGAAERRDVRFVAEHSRMEEPVAMLLSPANFEWAVAQSFRTAPEDVGRKQRLRVLAEKLFGDTGGS